MFAESLPEADFVVGFQNYSGLPTTLRNALQPTTSTSGQAEARVQVRTVHPFTTVECIQWAPAGGGRYNTEHRAHG